MDETEVMSTNVENGRTPSANVENGRTPSGGVENGRRPSASVENSRGLSGNVESGRTPSNSVDARRQRDALVRAVAAATARNIAASLRARRSRPVENGLSGAAPAVPSLDYRAATPDQREALKQRIRDAAAHGRKVYPT